MKDSAGKESGQPHFQGCPDFLDRAGGKSAPGMGVSAGPGPEDGAAVESGIYAVVFEGTEELLEGARVEEIGVVAGGPVSGALA